MRPWIEIRPNRLQMIRYLMNFGAPVRGYGFFDNIEIVPAGSVIELEVGSRAQTNTFADLPRMIQRSKTDELMELTKKQAVDRVDELLQRSVNRMLLADAPVGALCSGGVDSSLLMAMAAKSHDNLAIFHANVVGRDSEYAAAAALAQHLNLDLLKVDVQDDDFIDMTSDVLYHYEQPFSGHPHSVPFMMVSRLVQDSGVKGVLTGEGADECFLGYSYIAHEPFWDFYKRQVERVESFVQRIPVLGHQLVETENEIPELVTDMMEQFDGALNRKQIREHYVERLGRSPDRNVRTLDLLSNHLRTLLHRNDTMGMGASIEARFPFLDEHLVETAINLPYKFKIRFAPDVWEKDHPFLRDKWVMRQVADRYLPKPLSQREKRGFVVSAFQRMKIENEFFDNSFVSKHFKLGARETALLLDTADPKLKVKLMMLESWGRIFIEGVAPDAVKERLKKHASVSPARN